MNFRSFVVFDRFWFPFSGFVLLEWYFLRTTRGLREVSGNSAGISGDSGEMGTRRVRRGPSLPDALGARMTVLHTNSLT